MQSSRGKLVLVGAALVVASLSLVPAPAANVLTLNKRNVAGSLSAPGSLGSFTPAAANPRMAAAFARSGFGSGGFHFTPSSAPGSRRAVTVAVRARASTKAEAERTAMVAAPAIAPSAYNLGASVGWKQFAVSGDFAKIDPGVMPGGREAVDLGVSYTGRQWSTRLQVASDRSLGDQPRLIGNDQT
jgi:hypothetical protein